MSTQKLFLSFLLLVLITLLSFCGGGGDPAGPFSSSELFEVGLVRVADLDATQQSVFGSFGADPLARGRVEAEVEMENGGQVQQSDVEAEVEGAAANDSYAVSFCPFAVGVSGCSQVGSVTTDGQGQGKTKLNLARNRILVGVFLFSRNGQNRFVTGINIPRLPNDRGGAFEVALQPVAAVSGGIGSSFPLPGADPLMSGRVEVGGGRKIEVAIAGAMANATYNVQLCPFGLGAGACTTAGSLGTNSAGQAAAEFDFPQQVSFTGVFLLTRTSGSTEVPQFVTGFSVP